MKRKHLKLEFQDLSTEEKISSFEKTFSIISEMRKLRNAPVDTMVKKKIINTQGSEAISDRKDPQIFRYHVLISVMLSSQTKDEVTAKAMSNLKNYGLTIDNILSTDQVKIEELIYPVGFYKRKAKYILETTKILKEKFNSDIPRSMEEIKSLKGVGPKMAQIVKNVGWNEYDFFINFIVMMESQLMYMFIEFVIDFIGFKLKNQRKLKKS